jgi:hypothetical protein
MRPLLKSTLLDDQTAHSMHTLIVGDVRNWAAGGRATDDFDDFQYASFGELTRDKLDHIAPQMILSPLVASEFDVIDLARHLQDIGYAWCYRVIAPNLPNADIIRAEVAAVAPIVDFDLFQAPTNAPD